MRNRPETKDQRPKTLILGIGNTIRGDDGVGIHLARRLREILPPHFEIKELATAGLSECTALLNRKNTRLATIVSKKEKS